MAKPKAAKHTMQMSVRKLCKHSVVYESKLQAATFSVYVPRELLPPESEPVPKLITLTVEYGSG
jgi:hypothetical protein